uniref:Cilia- and flagella-associated protein HOATZ n=1 Tax=Buteo japonicus TaxID=224669 RepID=A0A8C0ASL4_9AVES
KGKGPSREVTYHKTEQHLMAPDGPLVFAGSSPANVGFARTFWTSAVLPPPLESCLGPATLEREGTLPGEGTLPSEETLPAALYHLWAQSMEKTKVKEKFLQQVRTINPDSFFINISIHRVSFGGTPELWKWHDEQ